MRECLRRKSAARTAAMNGARESPSHSKATAPKELPHDGRMCVVDGADDGGEAVVLVGAPAGEEMRREKPLIPRSRDDGSPFGGTALSGALERLADAGRERVAPRLPRSDIICGRGNHRHASRAPRLRSLNVATASRSQPP